MADHRLTELATGRFYIDGEPEVRLRQGGAAAPAARLLAVVTMMGDGDEPVGLTYSLFAAGALEPDEARRAAGEEIASRVAAAGGTVIRQDVRPVAAVPQDIARFVVVAMLREAGLCFGDRIRY